MNEADKLRSVEMAEGLGVHVKPVADYPDYFVTDKGEVYSTKSDIPLKLSKGKTGSERKYYSVSLSRPGETSTIKIHTLVLNAFVGPPAEGMECRHLNGDSFDNCLCNLAWGTRMDNQADKEAHGRAVWGESHGHTTITEETAREIKKLALKGDLMQQEIADMFGVGVRVVSQIKTGTNWKHLKLEPDPAALSEQEEKEPIISATDCRWVNPTEVDNET